MSIARPLPEPDDPQPHRKLTLHQQRVTDSITNTHGQGGAADHTAARHMPPPAAQTPDPQPVPITADRESRTIDWSDAFNDPECLHPSDIFSEAEDWGEPDYPDPSWPGWLATRKEHSMTYVLAVSPLLLERYPDRAADLWANVFPIGRYVHWRRDPEPDLEAEP